MSELLECADEFRPRYRPRTRTPATDQAVAIAREIDRARRRLRRLDLHPDEDVRLDWMACSPSEYWAAAATCQEELLRGLLAAGPYPPSEPGEPLHPRWARDLLVRAATLLTGVAAPEAGAIRLWAEMIRTRQDGGTGPTLRVLYGGRA